MASYCFGRPWECFTRGSLETALESWFLDEDLCVAQWQALHRNLYHYISLNVLGIVFHYTVKVTSLLQIRVACIIERQLCLSRDSTDSCSRYLLLWIHWNDVQCNSLCHVPTRWSMVLHWRLSLWFWVCIESFLKYLDRQGRIGHSRHNVYLKLMASVRFTSTKIKTFLLSWPWIPI